MCSLRIYKGSYAKESGLNLDPFMIHETFLYLTETAFGSHPCRVVSATSFTAVTRVQIPSGTPNLFRNLQPIAGIAVGTKRHNSDRIPTSFAVPSPLFSPILGIFSQAQKGTCAPICLSADGRTRCTQQRYDVTLSFTFVKCDCLRIGIERDPAGSVTE